jgi:hypothetical protein
MQGDRCSTLLIGLMLFGDPKTRRVGAIFSACSHQPAPSQQEMHWPSFERGDYKSTRAAAIAAGIIKPPAPLDLLRKAWAKASPDERSAGQLHAPDACA